MSKLAHSNDETMAEIDVKKMFENEDYGLYGVSLIVPETPQCDRYIPEGRHKDGFLYQTAGQCLHKARFQTKDGGKFCQKHAEKYIKEMVLKIDKIEAASTPVITLIDSLIGDKMNTTENDYRHFLSYSGLTEHPLTKYAYFHGASANCDKPDVLSSRLILIETHINEGIEWGVSKNGSNPESKDYFKLDSYEQAINLIEFVNGYTTG